MAMGQECKIQWTSNKITPDSLAIRKETISFAGKKTCSSVNYNKDINYFRAILISLAILVHIVNFGNIYPSVKGSVLAFMMPTFLIITGYLVNINKTVKDFALYILRILLPYTIMVLGMAFLSLYLPMRDGIERFDPPTILNVLFIKSIGPYWYLHAMIVCGILYFTAFRIAHRFGTVARLSIFASLLIIVAMLTPFLNIKAAVYYFIGVAIRHCINDFSLVYRKNMWPAIPFALLICNPYFHDWGAISILVCAISFLCFSSYTVSFLGERTKNSLDYIGRNTLPIYIFHPIFTMLSKFILPAFSFDPTGIVHTLFTIAMGIVGSLGIAFCMDRTRLSYIFGKKQILR